MDQVDPRINLKENFAQMPHKTASYGKYEVCFSSLAGLVHIGHGVVLAVYNLVVPGRHFFTPDYEDALTARHDVRPSQHLKLGLILLIPVIGSIVCWFFYYPTAAGTRAAQYQDQAHNLINFVTESLTNRRGFEQEASLEAILDNAAFLYEFAIEEYGEAGIQNLATENFDQARTEFALLYVMANNEVQKSQILAVIAKHRPLLFPEGLEVVEDGQAERLRERVDDVGDGHSETREDLQTVNINSQSLNPNLDQLINALRVYLQNPQREVREPPPGSSSDEDSTTQSPLSGRRTPPGDAPQPPGSDGNVSWHPNDISLFRDRRTHSFDRLPGGTRTESRRASFDATLTRDFSSGSGLNPPSSRPPLSFESPSPTPAFSSSSSSSSSSSAATVLSGPGGGMPSEGFSGGSSHIPHSFTNPEVDPSFRSQPGHGEVPPSTFSASSHTHPGASTLLSGGNGGMSSTLSEDFLRSLGSIPPHSSFLNPTTNPSASIPSSSLFSSSLPHVAVPPGTFSASSHMGHSPAASSVRTPPRSPVTPSFNPAQPSDERKNEIAVQAWRFRDEGRHAEAAELFEQIEQFSEAAESYQEAGNVAKATDCAISASMQNQPQPEEIHFSEDFSSIGEEVNVNRLVDEGKYLEAAQVCMAQENWEQAAEYFEIAENIPQAAICVSKMGNPTLCLEKARIYLNEKQDWASAGLCASAAHQQWQKEGIPAQDIRLQQAKARLHECALAENAAKRNTSALRRVETDKPAPKPASTFAGFGVALRKTEKGPGSTSTDASQKGSNPIEAAKSKLKKSEASVASGSTGK